MSVTEMRYLIAILIIVALYFWYRASNNLGSMSYIWPAALWLLNVGMFNLFRVACYSCVSVQALNSWSLGIQIHGILTLIGLGYILSRMHRWTP